MNRSRLFLRRIFFVAIAVGILTTAALYALNHVRGRAQENELRTALESDLLFELSKEERNAALILDHVVVRRSNPASGGILYFLGLPNQARTGNVWILLNPSVEPVLMQQPLGEPFDLSEATIAKLQTEVPLHGFVFEELSRRANRH